MRIVPLLLAHAPCSDDAPVTDRRFERRGASAVGTAHFEGVVFRATLTDDAGARAYLDARLPDAATVETAHHE